MFILPYVRFWYGIHVRDDLETCQPSGFRFRTPSRSRIPYMDRLDALVIDALPVQSGRGRTNIADNYISYSAPAEGYSRAERSCRIRPVRPRGHSRARKTNFEAFVSCRNILS